MRNRLLVQALLFVALAGSVGLAQQAAPKTPPAVLRAPTARPLPIASPESVGVSAERLDRLHRAMQDYVDRHDVGGVVTLIARDGKVADVHATGFQDVESRRPMQADTIFRIASMTKPITTVAVMMLEEEGKLFLTDPVSKYIPAFKGQRVAEGGTTVPARREITIRDLLSHRSGLSYGFLNGGPVGEAYRKDGVTDGLAVTSMSLQQGIDKLAAQPLMAQPGSAWNYSLSTDVLGRVVEVVSGMSFDAFLRDRITGPLGMNDTAFVVADSKWPRFSTVYSPDGNGGIRPMKDPEEAFGNAHLSQFAWYKGPKTYFSGGAGLTSTIQDYARFAQMLLNGGTLDGVRLLSPKTIELMTASQTSDLPPNGLLGPGTQFGLGFRVVTDVAQTQAQGSVGMYGWLGIYGTTFWVDPKEHLIAVMMVQRYPGSSVGAAFQSLVYSALTKSYVGRP